MRDFFFFALTPELQIRSFAKIKFNSITSTEIFYLQKGNQLSCLIFENIPLPFCELERMEGTLVSPLFVKIGNQFSHFL